MLTEAMDLARSAELPETLKANPDFALFLPIVMPQRFRADLAAFLDQRLRGDAA